MKKILIFLWIIAAIGSSISAQTIEDIGKITLGILMPGQSEGMNEVQLAKFKTKMEQICSKNGVVSSWSTNSFYLRPAIDIFQSEIVEGGMQNIYVIKGELTIFITQADGTTVNSISKSLKGSGNSKEKAINDLIANIPVGDPSFQSFLMEGKKKIINYYESRCADILLKANNLSQQEKYETAFALLMSVPEEVSCYKDITDKAAEIYSAYQDKLCAQLTSAANAALAIQDYYKAAEYLTQINPNSSCYSFAVNTFKKVEEKVSALEERDWNFSMKQYDDSVNLEKMRIQAVKEIAISYYKNQPDIHVQQFIK